MLFMVLRIRTQGRYVWNASCAVILKVHMQVGVTISFLIYSARLAYIRLCVLEYISRIRAYHTR